MTTDPLSAPYQGICPLCGPGVLWFGDGEEEVFDLIRQHIEAEHHRPVVWRVVREQS